MASRPKSTAKRPVNRFYRSAKVSEYQFKRVLWAFVLEQPVAEAAKHIALSANSIDALYGKLRRFFTALGVFEDIYQGADPREGTAKGEDFEAFEYHLLSFHLNRVRHKRRMKDTTLSEVDYNWCESHWRFHYAILTEGRPSEAVHRMMYAHLLAQIRICGPVGASPSKRDDSAALSLLQRNQRLLWLERNASAFRDPQSRAALKDIRGEANNVLASILVRKEWNTS